MQSLKFKSTRQSITVLMLFTAMIFAACTNNGNNQSTKDESKPKIPATDIHTAVVTGHIDAIRQHIAAGSDLNTLEPTGGSTALVTAVVLGRSEIATALIEGGADINKSNNDGSTPLYCAAFFGRTELVKLLLDKGADKSIRNNFGSTALESVSVPFESIKGIYDQISKDMGPLGLKLDYDKLQEARVEIATLLR